MLLSIGDTDHPGTGGSILDSEGVPAGSTVMEIVPLPGEEKKEEGKSEGGAGRMKQAVKAEADTSAAAKVLLDKYLRRPRT